VGDGMKQIGQKTILRICILFLCCISFVSCSSDLDSNPSGLGILDNINTSLSTAPSVDLDAIALKPSVKLTNVPTSSGVVIEETENGVIDYSHISHGYFMARYIGEKTDNESDIVIQVFTPNPTYP